jgi:4-hydroxybutyrate dehydrogenase
MRQLSLSSKINKFDTCKDFIQDFNISESDLIITCEYIYEPYFKDMDIKAQVIYQEKFGQGEPNDEMVSEMIQVIKPGYKRVIGIGGGTVLDISKLFVLKTMTPLIDLFQGKITPVKNAELVLVPTTCGTGSEVTNVAILGFNSLNTKLRLAVDELYADDAILIPELISNLPRNFFATSSIDALIHAIESSLSPLATPFSKLFGHKAIELIINGYRKLEKEGFSILDDLLEDFLIASNYAGIAFGKAGCGAVHAMSYPFSGKYHVAHGEANYVLLTSVLKKYYTKKCISNYDETITVLSAVLGCINSQVSEELDNLLSVVLEKQPMSTYGTTKDDIPVFADSVLKYQQVIMSHNPTVLPLSKEDIIDIYNDCL